MIQYPCGSAADWAMTSATPATMASRSAWRPASEEMLTLARRVSSRSRTGSRVVGRVAARRDRPGWASFSRWAIRTAERSCPRSDSSAQLHG